MATIVDVLRHMRALGAPSVPRRPRVSHELEPHNEGRTRGHSYGRRPLGNGRRGRDRRAPRAPGGGRHASARRPRHARHLRRRSAGAGYQQGRRLESVDGPADDPEGRPRFRVRTVRPQSRLWFAAQGRKRRVPHASPRVRPSSVHLSVSDIQSRPAVAMAQHVFGLPTRRPRRRARRCRVCTSRGPPPEHGWRSRWPGSIGPDFVALPGSGDSVSPWSPLASQVRRESAASVVRLNKWIKMQALLAVRARGHRPLKTLFLNGTIVDVNDEETLVIDKPQKLV
ncbi:hypothetical protein OF83DRAFT_1096143 [Amylostereum chailletii]|nr:hypothetical protein OF83DRAFT_1096143 [Amylostereum chailletii]